MALEVEGVVDDSVHAEKTLGGASRLEPLHLVSSSHRLMRVFRPIALGVVSIVRSPAGSRQRSSASAPQALTESGWQSGCHSRWRRCWLCGAIRNRLTVILASQEWLASRTRHDA